MKRLRLAGGRLAGRGHSRSSNQWVGGLLPGPFFIEHRAQPYRPDSACWMELPTRVIVHQTLVAADDTVGAVSRSLRTSMRQPAIGHPRQPGSIRVADPATAAEVRAEVGGALPVAIGPTPELDDFFDHVMVSNRGSELQERSYFAGGRLSPSTVEKLFAAGISLFRPKPWTVANETQVLRMDIPALGVDGGLKIGTLLPKPTAGSSAAMNVRNVNYAPGCQVLLPQARRPSEEYQHRPDQVALGLALVRFLLSRKPVEDVSERVLEGLQRGLAECLPFVEFDDRRLEKIVGEQPAVSCLHRFTNRSLRDLARRAGGKGALTP